LVTRPRAPPACHSGCWSDPAGALAPPYYLVAELGWDDMDELRLAFESPEGPATAQDVPRFADGGVWSMMYELEEV
jgi:uncharacterized protein (TIGR02118 family)